jgi:gluconokinase
MTRVLALDVGSSSVRAQVWDERAEPVDEESQLRYGGSDPREIVRLVREAVGGRDADVDAVATSCFGHSLLALDARGKPLTPVLGWRDTRAATAADRLARRLDGDAVHARTGCYLHPSYWPAKLAWLADEEPEMFRAARSFVSFPDYLYSELLGEEAPMSLSIASGTGLLELQKQTWDDELLDTIGVTPERLPRLGEEAVNGWFPPWFDGACSNVGAGCVEHTRAAVMIGTSAALRIVHETEQPLPRPGLFLYLLDDRRVVEGGAFSDGGNLHAWLERTLAKAEGSVLDKGPDEHGLTFLTLLGGERSPSWNPRARGAIDGLTFATTPRDLVQAALEGVGFAFAAVAELLPEIEGVVATGGALFNDADWIQLVADALGRPVVRCEVEEASARGAVVLALERLGIRAPEAPLGRVFAPRQERAEAYRSARARHERLYERLKGDWT